MNIKRESGSTYKEFKNSPIISVLSFALRLFTRSSIFNYGGIFICYLYNCNRNRHSLIFRTFICKWMLMNGNEMLYMMGNVQHLVFKKAKLPHSLKLKSLPFYNWTQNESRNNDGPSTGFYWLNTASQRFSWQKANVLSIFSVTQNYRVIF